MTNQFNHRRMAIQIGVALVVIAAFFFLVQNCGVQSSPTSGAGLRGGGYTCDCKDKACWDSVSNTQLKRGFSCLGTALGAASAGYETARAAGSVVYSASAEVKQLLQNREQLYKVISDVYNLSNSGLNMSLRRPDGSPVQLQITFLDLLKNVAGSTGDALNIFGGADLRSSPGLKCLAESAGLASKVFDTMVLLGKYVQSNGELDLYSSLKGLSLGVEDLTKLTTFFGTCAVAIEQDPAFSAQGKALVGNLSNYFKLVTGPLKLVFAIGECGFAVVSGTINLGGSVYCGLGDVQELADSSAALSRQRDATLQRPLRQGDGREGYECNNQWVGEASGAFLKYGIYLGRQNFFSYAYRSTACADYCGSTIGAEFCAQNAEAIFGEDADNCRATCNTRQVDGVVSICISHCCNQDNGCATDANARYQTFGE